MTNFEKWKSELTVEKLTYKNGIFGLSCGICPAYLYCLTKNEDLCLPIFKQWAESEVEE